MATILPLDDRRAPARSTPSRERVRLALTARGRRLVVLIAFMLGLAVAALGASVLDISTALAGGTQQAPATVTAESGDTLWEYAERYAPQADAEEFVQEARILNHLPTGRLTAGQTVLLPDLSARD